MRLFALKVGQARNATARVMSLLLSRGRSLFFDPVQTSFLLENGADQALRSPAFQSILNSMDVHQQLRILTAAMPYSSSFSRPLLALLPSLDTDTLRDLACMFDPTQQFMVSLNGKLSRALSEFKHAPHSSDGVLNQPNTETAVVEIYLTILLLLAAREASPETITRSARSSAAPSAESTPRLGSQTIAAQTQRGPAFVACGWLHSAAVTHAGALYTWGKNKFGELGLGESARSEEVIAVPRLVASLERVRVVAIACGAQHSIALSDLGTVFSWGRGQHGQLGLGEAGAANIVHTPQRVEALRLKAVVQVAAGYHHSLALTDSDDLFAWGWNAHGQLGVGDTVDVFSPKPVTALVDEPIVQISCGFCHSCARTANGEVFVWGSAQHGQVGDGTTAGQTSPRRIEGVLQGKVVVALACGAFHTLAVTDTGGVYTWGRFKKTKEDEPIDDDSTLLSPHWLMQFPSSKVVAVACGHWHSALLSADGKVYTWGESDSGQLGHGSTNAQRQPTQLAALDADFVTQIACGEEHTLCLSRSGTVYCWGRGNWGQLGTIQKTGAEFTALPIALEKAAFLSVVSTEVSPVTSQETPLAELTSLGGPQSHLESRLRSLFPRFRPTTMLFRAFDTQNFVAASVIYELLSDWSNALECRFQALKQSQTQRSDRGDQKEPESEAALGLVTSFFFRVDSAQIQSRLLGAILQYWSERQLAVPALERLFLERFSQMRTAFGLLLTLTPPPRSRNPPKLSGRGGSDWTQAPFFTPTAGADLVWQLPFSASFLLMITEAAIEQNQANQGPNLQGGVSSQRLWTEILDNIHKDLTQRPTIVLPILSAPPEDSASPVPPAATGAAAFGSATAAGRRAAPSKDTVAFSCGHYFSRKTFSEVLLPEFQQRMAQLPTPLPLTVAAMISTYRQPSASLACCVCVFGKVRQEQQSTQKPWLL
eukprot:TRINITY_DN7127_c0_g1_i1.p1 TRINITY_DN7127_c0_g1~~TRINITY_DN7127_c0_g1_i1.p1  ORF type:complete len:938 (+),score=202.27 TRINITY_DN7127_c0_g1_i1:1762-4575(+)